MSKLIMFPSVGRIEKFEAMLNMRTVIRVKHQYELILPQAEGDYFHLRDNQVVTAEIIARIQDGKDVVETVVRRYPLEVPPTMVNFFDSPMYLELGMRMKKKMNARAFKIKNLLEKQARQAHQQEEDMTAPPVSTGAFGSSTVALPTMQQGMMPSHVRRVEITSRDVASYESAQHRFKSFIDKRNRSAKESEEISLRKFVTSLRDSLMGMDVDSLVQTIENRVLVESEKAVKILG